MRSEANSLSGKRCFPRNHPQSAAQPDTYGSCRADRHLKKSTTDNTDHTDERSRRKPEGVSLIRVIRGSTFKERVSLAALPPVPQPFAAAGLPRRNSCRGHESSSCRSDASARG